MKMRMKFKKLKRGKLVVRMMAQPGTQQLYYPELTCELRQLKKDYLHGKTVRIAMSIRGAIMLSSVT